MKKKVTTYLLLAVAASVWGLIIYRILQAVNGNDEVETEKMVVLASTNKKEAESDTFSIGLNYADPFFNKVVAATSAYNNSGSYNYSSNNNSSSSSGVQNNTPKQTTPNVVKPVAKPASQVVVPTIDWNFISFNGLIKNAQTSTLVALINIHHKGHMMKEGDVNEGVKLLKAYKDSIQVEYQNEKKTIKRK